MLHVLSCFGSVVVFCCLVLCDYSDINLIKIFWIVDFDSNLLHILNSGAMLLPLLFESDVIIL